MIKLRQVAGALPFFTAVFLNAFVDLGHKIIIQNTVFKLYEGPQQVILIAVVNGLILLPFILLLSPAGFVSDKYRKTGVMRLSAWAAVAVTLAITVFYYLGWFWPAFAMTFWLACQSAVYSPAKLGYIKELFGRDRLGEANGVVSALSICAILAGIFAFSILFETWYPGTGADKADVLRAIAPVGWLLVANSLIELVMTYRLPAQPPTGVTERFDFRRYFSGRLFRQDINPLLKRRVIRLSVTGLATFWGVGQVMLAAFPAFIKEEMQVTNTIVVQGILACSGVGIALGSMFAGRMSKNHIETGLLPVGAVGIALGLVMLPHVDVASTAAFYFLFIGFMGGMFIVPLNAMIQFHAGEHELGRVLAANNWFQNVVMLSFLVLTVAFALLGLSSKSLLQLIAVVALIGGGYTIYQLPQSLTRILLTFFISRRYRVTVQGVRNIPAKGGVLLLGNHVSWVDWAIVQLASPRPVRFVMIRSIYERWYLKWFFDLFDCIPIEQGRGAHRALKAVGEALNDGQVVCLFPEGTISRTGHLVEFRRGFERACALVNDKVSIVPFYLRGLWGSQFSHASGRTTPPLFSILRRELIVAFGKPLPPTTRADVLKRRVLDLSIDSWQTYVAGLPTLPEVWLDTAKRMGGTLALADSTGRDLSGVQALAAAIALRRRIHRHDTGANVGLLLPNSSAGMLANMAVLLDGKTVVNLNYTAGPAALRSAIDQAAVTTVYTSRLFVKRLAARGLDMTTVLQSVEVHYLEDLVAAVSSLEKLATWLTVKALPVFVLKMVYCRARHGSDTAAILFSSGSEGTPKGVCLSHRNILANVKQTADVLNPQSRDVVLANLPLFHAFGLTITQFLPLLEGVPVVCHPDPTDALGSAKAIARYRVSILFATSTFLRLYNRNAKIHPLMLAGLRIVVAGAEKLSDVVRTDFKVKFGLDVYEGYGATETTPVASVNVPDKLDTRHWQVQRGQKVGSVGMPLPGSSCMVVDPDTLAELPTGEAGMVLIGGAQVMQEYLNDPERTAAAVKTRGGTRWYITGDKGYIDADGFLFIVDRYSRIAKIGGEMVSLGRTERLISQLLPDDHEIALIAVPDSQKGEKLVAYSTADIDPGELRRYFKDQEVTLLAFPSTITKVVSLPKLASGKTDYARLRREAAAES